MSERRMVKEMNKSKKKLCGDGVLLDTMELQSSG